MSDIKTLHFKAVVSDPANLHDYELSTQYLDPLMGVNSIELAILEQSIYGKDSGTPEVEGLGVDPTIMWSPYTWLHLMFKDLTIPNGDTVCDIGAGIGRLGIYLKAFRPDLHYIGLEKYRHRVDAANKAGAYVIEMDLEKNSVPQADVYYFFNSLSGDAYRRLIGDLKQLQARGEKFLLISARDPYGQFETFLETVMTIGIDYPQEHTLVVYNSSKRCLDLVEKE